MLLRTTLLVPFFFMSSWCDGFSLISTPPTVLTLQIIIDYAQTKNWKRLVFFDCIEGRECHRKYARPVYNCFRMKGIFTALKTLTHGMDLLEILKIKSYNVGVALLIDDIDLDQDDNLLRKMMSRNKNTRALVLGEYTSWLVLSTKWNNTQIFDAMREWPIGIDSDITIAMSFLSSDVVLSVLHQFSKNTCEELRNYGHGYDYAKLNRSQSVSAPEITFVQDTGDASKTITIFLMVSVYKIRVEGNASLEKENWNSWSLSHGFAKEIGLREHRTNLWHYNINVGLQTNDKIQNGVRENYDRQRSKHEGSTEVLQELLNLFEIDFNVRVNVTNFSNHGNAFDAEANDELIHALTSGEIDLGLFLLNIDFNQRKSFGYSLPILHFKRNIYFKPPESSNNEFLQQFSRGVLLGIAGTFTMIVTVMELINFVTVYIHWKEDEEHVGLGEAFIWGLSVMCMQGSPWLPRTRAGRVVLFTGLMFTLIIYNTYSGSITSLLSVETDSITSVSDFEKYDYTIGSIRIDDSDILADADLRPFYFKAMEKNQIEASEVRGLQKVSENKFAFLATDIVARQIFCNNLRFQSCPISEFPTNSSGIIALPLAIDSPFKKIINLSILRMLELGILRKMELRLKPPLLECKVNAGEHKRTGLGDVYGPFCILAIGFAASIILFYFEISLTRGRKLKVLMQKARHQLHLQDDSSSQAPTLNRQLAPLPRNGYQRRAT